MEILSSPKPRKRCEAGFTKSEFMIPSGSQSTVQQGQVDPILRIPNIEKADMSCLKHVITGGEAMNTSVEDSINVLFACVEVIDYNKANEAREHSNEVYQKERKHEHVREPQRKRSYPDR